MGRQKKRKVMVNNKIDKTTAHYPLTKNAIDELGQMGIPHDVLEHCDIQLSHDERYFVYPCQYPPRIDGDGALAHVVYDIVYRGRKLPSVLTRELQANTRTPRFFNPESSKCPNGKMPMFYTPNYVALKIAVIKNNGLLHLFEGDKDTWTALAAGMSNSAGIISAGSHIDSELAYHFRNMGVTRVRYYADNDKAGVDVARKIMDVLTSHGVDTEVCHVTIPNVSHVIKDTSNIWEFVNRDSEKYREILSNLTQWHMPTVVQAEYATTTDYFDESLYDVIERMLGIGDEFNSDGWSKSPVADPCVQHEHDDTNPAFYWNNKLHIGRCFKCGKSYLAYEVARGLNIRVSDYKSKNAKDKESPSMVTRDDNIKSQTKKDDVDSTTSILNDSFLAELSYLEEQYDSLDDNILMKTLSQSVSEYEERFNGAILPLFPPLPNPIKKFHHLQGNAQVIRRPSMVGIVGTSGGFKTSLCMYIATELIKKGYNGIVFSPEWDYVTQASKVVQAEGGAKGTRTLLQQQYYYEQAQIEAGTLQPDSELIFGEELTIEERARTIAAMDEVKAYSGTLAFMTTFSSDVTNILAQSRSIEKRMIRDGSPPSFMIIDYIQMADIPNNKRGWTHAHVVDKFKEETLRRGFVTFISSQSTKEATRAVSEGRSLDRTAALGIRDDKFNLFITLTPTDESTIKNVYDPITKQTIQRRCQEVIARVDKNSEGKKAISEENAPHIFFDLERMTMIDEVLGSTFNR